jgi:diaminopimelate decarboxylase
LARVTSVKSTSSHTFVGTDSGFNHLVRPAMYGAYHGIVNASRVEGAMRPVVVAGNICESGDVFTQGEDGLEDRHVTDPRVGDLLAIQDAGAYGMCLSSQYNLRPRPPEVLVTGDEARVIRRRESYEDLMRNFEGL